MAPFAMCPACQREYDDVGDRRFHAQPNACPVCGPRLTLLEPDGQPVTTGEPRAIAASRLAAGAIVAIKGLGGFHLACDARRGDVVTLLRARKHRDHKPFAVMVSGLAAARALADIDADEAGLLPGRGQFIEFSLEGLLRGATATRSEAYSKAVGRPWMQGNEARRLENMAPLPELDSVAEQGNAPAAQFDHPQDQADPPQEVPS